jgi:hypothetical protein
VRLLDNREEKGRRNGAAFGCDLACNLRGKGLPLKGIGDGRHLLETEGIVSFTLLL